jgi:hypothetical protein
MRHGQIKTLIPAAFDFFDGSFWQMRRIHDNRLFPFSVMNAHGEFDFSVFVNLETVFRPFRWEVLLFLVGITGSMSLLNRVVCGLSCEEVLVADGLNRLAVKMELSFRLFLQLAFGDPASMLEKVFFG